MPASDSQLEVEPSVVAGRWRVPSEETVTKAEQTQTHAPAKTKVSPPPKAEKKEPPPEEHPDDVKPGWGRFLITVPSWSVSMIVHMVVVIVLALCTVAPKFDPKTFVVQANYSDPPEELLEERIQLVELEAPKENSFASVLSDASDMGMADFGNAAEVSSTLASVETGDLNLGDDVGDIGQLFGTKGNGMASMGLGSGGAEFFGVKASGKRFVFVVDSSRSMRGGKFEDACQELFYAVQRLKSDQFFYVIFFDQNAARMTFAPKKEPEETFAQATSPNLKKLEEWMKTVELELQTNPYDALVFARSLSPDAIYILTDGKFTDKGRSVSYLRTNNLYKDPEQGMKAKTVIHTVGFYDPDGEENLKAIAKEHEGTYRFVPRPKK